MNDEPVDASIQLKIVDDGLDALLLRLGGFSAGWGTGKVWARNAG